MLAWLWRLVARLVNVRDLGREPKWADAWDEIELPGDEG